MTEYSRKPTYDTSSRDPKERIDRLRNRLQQVSIDPKLTAVLKGILDLLADEL